MYLEQVPMTLLLGLIVVLPVISAYFSSTETAMMALNRYRRRHRARHKHRGAIRAKKLLERPDRLIGLIRLGNNLANNFAAG